MDVSGLHVGLVESESIGIQENMLWVFSGRVVKGFLALDCYFGCVHDSLVADAGLQLQRLSLWAIAISTFSLALKLF